MKNSIYHLAIIACVFIISSCGSGSIEDIDIEGDTDIEPRVSLKKSVSQKFYVGAAYGQFSGEGKKPTILTVYPNDIVEEIVLDDDTNSSNRGELTLTGPGTVDQQYTYKYIDLISGIQFVDTDRFDLFGSFKLRHLNSLLTLQLRENGESITQDRDTLMHGVAISPHFKLMPSLFGYLEAEVLIGSGVLNSQKHSIGLKFAPLRNISLFLEATNFIYSDDRERSKIYLESNHISTGLNFEF